jgi:ABC-type phosphate transport system substrate-binding protein
MYSGFWVMLNNDYNLLIKYQNILVERLRGGMMLTKNLRISGVAHQLMLSTMLVFGSTPLFATDNHHSRGSEFSDPAVLAKVPDGWKSKPVKHIDKHPDADLVVSLGQQSYPLFSDLIPEYASANNLKIVVKQGTCGITSGRLLKKKVDVGAFCCPPGKSDRLPGLKFYSLGISPIALIVNTENPLSNLSTKQAEEIFEGNISRWSEIGSDNNQLIKPVGRLHCKKRPGHWRSMLKSSDDFSSRLFEVGVIPDMISQVSRSASSIGWETPLMVEYHKKKGNVKVLKVDGHFPSEIDYVLTGKYPLYRSYTLTAWEKKSKTNQEAVKLIRYLQQHVEKVHKDINFIPVSRLKDAGWVFVGDELVGEPGKKLSKK